MQTSRKNKFLIISSPLIQSSLYCNLTSIYAVPLNVRRLWAPNCQIQWALSIHYLPDLSAKFNSINHFCFFGNFMFP
jgi:hypothetical protein